MKWIHIGLMLIATVILLFSLLILFAYANNLINFPYDYDQGEGFELVDTIMFSQFRYPYQNTDSYPFYSSNYPPLFHIMAAPFVWLFGNAYWYGRLLGTLATLITAATIYFAVHREGNRHWIAILSALAFLSSNTIYHIAPLFRQHMMMVMFETLAIVILARAFPKQQKRLIALGLFLIILAGFTKQLAAITALAVIAWMILRNPRRGILWSIAFSLLGGLIFLWITIDTNGEWWRQAILANVNEFNPFQTFGLTLLWLRLHFFLIIPALFFTLYEIYFERISLYSTWFVVATILGAFGSGTWGAGDSYFATSIAAICILSGIFLSKILNQSWSLPENNPYTIIVSLFARLNPISAILIPLLFIGYGISTFKMPTDGGFFGTIANVLQIEPNIMGRYFDSATYDVLGYANIGHFVTEEDYAAAEEIMNLYSQTSSLILSEEAGFNLVAGRTVITNPTQLRNLWLAGLWQGDELVDMIENQQFAYIILRAQFYPVPVLEAIGQYYEIERTVAMNGFEYWILHPLE
jgi:dolichyl-phosphate-mannose-protein mannosyltransferase